MAYQANTPMGPGFFIFFHIPKEHGTWADRDDGSARKKREEDEILILLHTMYESGQF